MGILLHDCYGFYADVKAYDLADDTANEKYGYGLCVQAACANGIVDVGGERCRHVFTTNGWWGVDNLGGYGGVNNLIIRGSASQCTAEGMDTHGSGTNIIFYGCHLEGNVRRWPSVALSEDHDCWLLFCGEQTSPEAWLVRDG